MSDQDKLQGTVDEAVGIYVYARNRVREIEERHEKELAPWKEKLNLLQAWLTEFLDKAGATSIKTKHGTATASVRYSASLEDPDEFMKYVIRTNKFDLLDRRANATAVKDFVAENKELPPGCKLSALRSIGVRKPPA